MCGRFFLTPETVIEGISRLGLDARIHPEPSWKTGDVCPMDNAPVIAGNRRRQMSLFSMRWGYTTDNGRVIINARTETVSEKLLFADGIANRRCVIPIDGYYEWRHIGREQMKYAVSAKEPVYLAGIYRFEQQRPVFVVLTREPSSAVAHIHHRMPLMYSGSAAAKWLQTTGNVQEILDLACLNVTARLMEGTEPMYDLLSQADAAGIHAWLEE